MMTVNRRRRDPYPLLLARLTYTERQVLYAHLNSGWAKQAAVYPRPSEDPVWAETCQIMGDVNAAEEIAAACREAASATCRACGADGTAADLEKITVRPVGGGATRTEWLCNDRFACTGRKFPQIASTLAALTAQEDPA